MPKLLPPRLFLITIAFMLLADYYYPVTTLVPSPYSWIGIPPLVGGLGIAIWHKRLFKQAGTDINTFGEPNKLVTGGLYKRSRNPMYLGFVVALLGVAILLGSLKPLLPLAIFILITDRWYIAYEESAMRRKFGEDYLDYQARVRRWI